MGQVAHTPLPNFGCNWVNFRHWIGVGSIILAFQGTFWDRVFRRPCFWDKDAYIVKLSCHANT
jgi:hypothetical protein